jgi:hypothetical protein
MASSTYDLLVMMMSVLCGGIALTAVVQGARREPGFLTHRYWKWLAVVFAWSLATPVVYMWLTPAHISYADAALLRVRSVGWRHVAIAYVVLVSLLAGGIVGALWNAIAPAKGDDPS